VLDSFPSEDTLNLASMMGTVSGSCRCQQSLDRWIIGQSGLVNKPE
jgi:hypothetical protein